MTKTAKAAISIGVGVALVFATAYVVSCFLALDSLSRAVRAGDRDRLSVLVDFPAVRSSLKDQFSSLVTKRVNEQELKTNPFAGLVLALVPVALDKIVDAIVTPDGVLELLERPIIGDHSSADGGGKKRWKRSWSYVDINHFRAQYIDPDDPRLVFSLLFKEHGFFGWKLVSLDLPGDELTRRFVGAGGSSANSPGSQEGTSGTEGEQTALPGRVGACSVVSVKRVTTRLEDADGTEIAGSGSAIEYANGGYQVSYDTIDGIEHSRAGDRIELCLTEIPQHCPPGDNRGRIYHAFNLRTREEWSAPDAEHSCGGA